ncbi:hypothetical protein MTDSW087_05902 [Methylobacterium dankookense]|uniref:Uncharacterized protein n=1 Tax=Methylobacterium dankookense TaxID=560405 RepID=A0A564G6F2_9HYPH|nr:hypothetical protein IFDJLNFL_5291 [Methylobacterium dankookense]VUF16145.1 hypothetical protein MTDSW087_05902 [Methylobacterium dankookense]
MNCSGRCATPSNPAYAKLRVFIIRQPVGLLNRLTIGQCHHHVAELTSNPDGVIGVVTTKGARIQEHERVTTLAVEHYAAILFDHVNPMHQAKIDKADRHHDGMKLTLCF